MISKVKIYVAFALTVSILLYGCSPDAPVQHTDKPSAPAGVRLVSAGMSSLVFSWEESEGADYYVGRHEESDGSLVSGGQMSTRETSLKYEGLAPETSYVFKVRVKIGDEDSPYSAPFTAQTLGADAPGSSPGTDPGTGTDPFGW
jgi:hypothetical protein